MSEEDADLFREIDSWFAEELPFPEPCMRREPVVCFFKTENTDLMMKMITPAMWLLERYNHPFYVVYTNDPGEIVYEDEYQVAVRVPEVAVTRFHHQWAEPGSGLFGKNSGSSDESGGSGEPGESDESGEGADS